jgi:hypothetical protein
MADGQFEMVVVQNDRYPDVIVTVLDENDQVVNLTGATSVLFSMRHSRTGAVVLDGRPGSVLDGPNGKLVYAWAAGETNIAPGTYEGQFRVSPLVGDVFRFPTIQPLAIHVRARIG